MLAFIGPLLGSGWTWVAIVTVGLLAYDRAIDDPAVRREARQGYVAEAEEAALQAELQESLRQKLAAEANAALWQQQLIKFQGEQDAREAETESDIAEMEAKLRGAGKSCRLDRDALDWLRRRGG